MPYEIIKKIKLLTNHTMIFLGFQIILLLKIIISY
jgi:hypothetical protein